MEECVVKKYMNPEIEIVRFTTADVLSASGSFVGGDNTQTDNGSDSDDIVVDFGDIFNP